MFFLEHPDWDDDAEFIEDIKEGLNIDKPNDEMSFDEIELVLGLIGDIAPDTTWEGGKPTYGNIGIEMIKTIALKCFPKYYQEHLQRQTN